ncbi:MAG: hypothetical protein M3426_05830, partial [Actinomycetota bacterium]|nr:hypothetical protein [Actinomycetota bacterium]
SRSGLVWRGHLAEALDGPLELGENMLSSGAGRRAHLQGSGGDAVARVTAESRASGSGARGWP